MPVELKSCTFCGSQPQMAEGRSGEESESVQYRCICGHAGEEIEDAYVDEGMRLDAARSWNQAN